MDEHVEQVLARVHPTEALRLSLAELAQAGPGLALAQECRALADVPAFDHAAVDGYAFSRPEASHGSGPVIAEVVRGIRAGDDAGAALRPGQAVRVMTGAPVPAGADVVVPVEHSSTGAFTPGKDDDETRVTLTLHHRDNIRRRGEDLTAGTVLAEPGDPVTPALVATAAAAGLSELLVHRRPRVAVLSTGSELRPAPRTPATGPDSVILRDVAGSNPADRATATATIPDSNSLMLAAIASTTGAEVLRVGAIPDDAATVRTALDAAVAAGADLIVTTGGVSAGAWDVVRQVLLEGDPATDVDLMGVEMSPGRPQALATWRGVPWIGLPGTPTAAFTAAHLFVVPAIDRLSGHAHPGLHRASLPVALDDAGKRTRVVPVRVDTASASPVVVPLATGGHALSALLTANGLAVVPPGTTDGVVDVLMLRGQG